MDARAGAADEARDRARGQEVAALRDLVSQRLDALERALREERSQRVAGQEDLRASLERVGRDLAAETREYEARRVRSAEEAKAEAATAIGRVMASLDQARDAFESKRQTLEDALRAEIRERVVGDDAVRQLLAAVSGDTSAAAGQARLDILSRIDACEARSQQLAAEMQTEAARQALERREFGDKLAAFAAEAAAERDEARQRLQAAVELQRREAESAHAALQQSMQRVADSTQQLLTSTAGALRAELETSVRRLAAAAQAAREEAARAVADCVAADEAARGKLAEGVERTRKELAGSVEELRAWATERTAEAERTAGRVEAELRGEFGRHRAATVEGIVQAQEAVNALRTQLEDALEDAQKELWTELRDHARLQKAFKEELARSRDDLVRVERDLQLRVASAAAEGRQRAEERVAEASGALSEALARSEAALRAEADAAAAETRAALERERAATAATAQRLQAVEERTGKELAAAQLRFEKRAGEQEATLRAQAEQGDAILAGQLEAGVRELRTACEHLQKQVDGNAAAASAGEAQLRGELLQLGNNVNGDLAQMREHWTGLLRSVKSDVSRTLDEQAAVERALREDLELAKQRAAAAEKKTQDRISAVREEAATAARAGERRLGELEGAVRAEQGQLRERVEAELERTRRELDAQRALDVAATQAAADAERDRVDRALAG
eukprot:tig00000101_g4439.t1